MIDASAHCHPEAYQYYGQFIDLQDYARDEKYVFDLILAKPKSKTLFKAYDNALRLLQKPTGVKLIEFGDLELYSKDTVQHTLQV